MCVKTLIEELGYGGMRIGFKSDNAEELIALRKRVAELRTKETVPIIVPVRVSHSNGAIERAARTWQGQFRTLRSHLEDEVGVPIIPDHPIWQWGAWWASGILRRYALRGCGRTSYEIVTGHRTNSPIACFGETVLLRRNRKEVGSGKWDCEYQEGVFLGLGTAGVEILIGTPEGIVHTQDIRRLEDGRRFSRSNIAWITQTIEEWLDPEAAESKFVDEVPVGAPGPSFKEPEVVKARRIYFYPNVFHELENISVNSHRLGFCFF